MDYLLAMHAHHIKIQTLPSVSCQRQLRHGTGSHVYNLANDPDVRTILADDKRWTETPLLHSVDSVLLCLIPISELIVDIPLPTPPRKISAVIT